ncbi:hypothetical protein [uncultured Legionella sp.]|uniref:hypothetical protein n=1 Tax=uncultured Legionella sp. TaxID=210934 RepID=UPI0026199673|nr:hypothetical protein [uncultured Legionella sp.]
MRSSIPLPIRGLVVQISFACATFVVRELLINLFIPSIPQQEQSGVEGAGSVIAYTYKR